MLHSSCAIDAELREALEALGPVACIVAPGSVHHLAHGDLIEDGAKAVARDAWQSILSDRNTLRFGQLRSSE